MELFRFDLFITTKEKLLHVLLIATIRYWYLHSLQYHTLLSQYLHYIQWDTYTTYKQLHNNTMVYLQHATYITNSTFFKFPCIYSFICIIYNIPAVQQHTNITEKKKKEKKNTNIEIYWKRDEKGEVIAWHCHCDVNQEMGFVVS